MRYRMPPLNAIRAFEAAARLGSFSKAAEELCVTQGAISRHIKILEDRVNTQLFQRRHRQVQLTSGGLAYSQSIRKAFDIIQEETNNLNPDLNDKMLRIKSFPTFAIRWLVPRLSNFTLQKPEYGVSIYTQHSFADFESSEIDGSIEFGSGNWRGLASDRLFPTMLTPVCSPRLANGTAPPKSVKDLSKYVLLHSKHRPELWNLWLSAIGETGIPTRDVVLMEDSGLTYQAAADGIGIALGELGYIGDDIRTGRLVTPFDFVLTGPESYYLVYPPRSLSVPKFASFRKWILAQAETTRTLA
jgi:LysR family glycine cleavage system transcriptional activator